MASYIKLFRSVQQHWVWEDKPFSRGQAWIDLLMFVYRFDTKEPIGGQIEVTKAGSRWTGYRELGERWGWSSGKVKRFLKLLESDEMVNIKCTTSGTLVTIIKYRDFQIERHTNDTPTTHERNTNDTRANTEKKVKKVEKVENINPPFIPPTVGEVAKYVLSVGSQVDAEEFVAFYESKDWMVGKNKMKSWKSAIVTWEKKRGLKRNNPEPVKEVCDEEPAIDLWGEDDESI